MCIYVFFWCLLGFPGVLREVTTHFIADARTHNVAGGNHVKACIVNPSGTNTDAYITDKGDGTYRIEYTAYEDGKMFNRGLSFEIVAPVWHIKPSELNFSFCWISQALRISQ